MFQTSGAECVRVSGSPTGLWSYRLCEGQRNVNRMLEKGCACESVLLQDYTKVITKIYKICFISAGNTTMISLSCRLRTVLTCLISHGKNLDYSVIYNLKGKTFDVSTHLVAKALNFPLR